MRNAMTPPRHPPESPRTDVIGLSPEDDSAPCESTDRVEATFNMVLKGAPNEQARILEEACGDDADLRARVRRLLAAHERAGEVFDEVISLRSKRVARHSSEQLVSR
jgi:hypothetical protein